jgi:hypothetical protein
MRKQMRITKHDHRGLWKVILEFHVPVCGLEEASRNRTPSKYAR